MHFYSLTLTILVLTKLFFPSIETPIDSISTYHVKLRPSDPETLELPARKMRLVNTQSSPSTTADPQSTANNISDPGPKLPRFKKFLGVIDLKTGTYIIAALGVVQVFFSGCTLFMGISYLIITIWILYIIYTILSVVLFCSLVEMINDRPLIILSIWVWYGLIFVALMILLMILLGVFLVLNRESEKLIVILAGLLWYGLTIYFIFVVNSYRMQLWDEMGKPNVNATKHPVNDQTDEPIDQINKPQPHIQNNYPLEQQEILNNQSDNPPQHKETPNDQSVNPPEHKETTPNDQNVNPSEQKDTRRKFKPNDDSNKLPLKFAILSFQDSKPLKTSPPYPSSTTTSSLTSPWISSTLLLIEENWADS